MGLKLIRVANAREHEHMGRVDRAAAQDDFARGAHRVRLPACVSIGDTGDALAKLESLGLVLEPGAHESARLPRVGTMAHMAPEQGLGKEVGPASDWYSLGSVLFECLTGRHPYVGEAIDVLHQKQTRDPEVPSRVAPGVLPDLDKSPMQGAR